MDIRARRPTLPTLSLDQASVARVATREESSMSDQHDNVCHRPPTPKTGRSRHETAVLIAIFVLAVIGMIVYEVLR